MAGRQAGDFPSPTLLLDLPVTSLAIPDFRSASWRCNSGTHPARIWSSKGKTPVGIGSGMGTGCALGTAHKFFEIFSGAPRARPIVAWANGPGPPGGGGDGSEPKIMPGSLVSRSAASRQGPPPAVVQWRCWQPPNPAWSWVCAIVDATSPGPLAQATISRARWRSLMTSSLAVHDQVRLLAHISVGGAGLRVASG